MTLVKATHNMPFIEVSPKIVFSLARFFNGKAKGRGQIKNDFRTIRAKKIEDHVIGIEERGKKLKNFDKLSSND